MRKPLSIKEGSMDRNSPLDAKILTKLGFVNKDDFWFHSQEINFAIKLESACFYISFHGYLAKYPHNRTVGELERQFYERTGQLLF